MTRASKPARRRAIVIGAGLGGLATAIGLERAGWEVFVFERTQLPPSGFGIGITPNGLQALDVLGAYGAVSQAGRVAEVAHIKTRRGYLIKTTPVRELSEKVGFPMRVFHRAELHQALLSQLSPDRVKLGACCVGVDYLGQEARARFADGSEVAGDVLIGADGINSVVRQALHGKGHGPEDASLAGYVTWLAVMELSHPMLTPGYNAHYWGTGSRFGIHDAGGGRWYWWATKNRPAEPAQLRELHTDRADRSELLRLFRGWAHEVRHVIKATPSDRIYRVHARDRDPLTWWGRGRATLLGDAAHPMLTSLAQGACTSFEDAAVLTRCLEVEPNIQEALQRYEKLRIPRTTQIVLMTRRMSAYEQAGHPVSARLRNASYFHLPDSTVQKWFENAGTFVLPEVPSRRAAVGVPPLPAAPTTKLARGNGTSLQRDIVVVTGASSGIGRAIALALEQAGYTVFAGVRQQAASRELSELGRPRLRPVRLDVVDPESIDQVTAEVRELVEGGYRLRALVNNAGICVISPLEMVSRDQLREQFEVNTLGANAMTQATLPFLLQAQGRIVNIGSTIGWTRPPFFGPYAASKAALEALSEVWRRELAGTGVTVSLVVPGPVMTPVWDKVAHAAQAVMAHASEDARRRHQLRLERFLWVSQETAARTTLTADCVAKTVLEAVRQRAPKKRYELGLGTTTATVVAKGMPAAFDFAFGRGLALTASAGRGPS